MSVASHWDQADNQNLRFHFNTSPVVKLPHTKRNKKQKRTRRVNKNVHYLVKQNTTLEIAILKASLHSGLLKRHTTNIKLSSMLDLNFVL